ncbi:RNA ligase family protein [Bacillus sp. JJ1533]|uniref:ATP-dependent DNA ligase n=1 Tax=Bacillus sp. JJ1533 TaxID=3122959 RepID=UPI002FFEB32A
MFISPMLLQKSNQPFNDESYITELKLDGFRMILSKWDDKIKLYSRHNNDITAKFPELTTLNIPNGTVLDGELVVSDENGKPDFESTMERFMSSKTNHHAQFCVFDIIYFKGEKVVSLPLLERKTLLQDVLPTNHPHVAAVQWIQGNGSAYFDLIKQNGLEGIVLKKIDNSPYEIGKRSYSWLKVINYQYDDNILIYGLRKDKFGLLLSFQDGTHAGLMEFMPPEQHKQLYSMYKVVSENDKFKYIKPIPVRVKYRNLTKQGKLRIPSFVEWL